MYESRYVTVDGLRTRYLDHGQGPAVVLIHGGGSGTTADTFEHNIGPLASRGLRMIALDLPGHGTTDNPEDYSAAYTRQFIVKFMDALGLDRASLVGHSLGGMLCAQLAFDYPHRVERLVVVATGRTMLPPAEGQVGDGAAPETVAAEPTLEDARKHMESLTFNQAYITDELVERYHKTSLGKNFQATLARQTTPPEPPPGPPMWQRLDKIPVPARFLYGQQDRARTGERALIAQRMYPGLDLHVFDGCKHNIMWDKPKEFDQLIAEVVLAGREAAVS